LGHVELDELACRREIASRSTRVAHARVHAVTVRSEVFADQMAKAAGRTRYQTHLHPENLTQRNLGSRPVSAVSVADVVRWRRRDPNLADPSSREKFERAALTSVAASRQGRHEEVDISTRLHLDVLQVHAQNRVPMHRARKALPCDEHDEAPDFNQL